MSTQITVTTEITTAEFTTMDTNTTSTGSILTLEKTILSILNVGGSSANTIRVNGFTSIILPKEWVNIVVTNLSITDEGGFEVFMK
jgi:hypothetical protein